MNQLKITFGLLFKYFLTTLVFIFSFAIGAFLSITPSTTESSADSNDAAFLIVALINAAVFSYWLYRSERKGKRLLVYFLLVYFGVNTVMPQVETLFFSDAKGFEGIQKWGIIQMGLINTLLFCPLSLLIWKKFKQGNIVSDFLPWKISKPQLFSLSLFYVLVYFLFGYYIAWQSAAVRVFYNGNDELLPFITHFQDLLKTNFWIFPFQLLRGFCWVGLAYLIIQVFNKSRWENGLVVALIFSMPATFLWMSNPFMPEAVRMAHFTETLSSNFIYGFIVGWVLSRN